MNTLFEDRSTYAPTADPVAVVTLVVECNPGQVVAVQDFLAEVRDKAGVYSVDIDLGMKIPTPEPELSVEMFRTEPPVPTELAHEPLDASAAPVVGATLATITTAGEAHGERQLQQADPDPHAADLESGSEAAAGGEPESVDAGADSELAEPAGEVGAGAVERSA